MTAFQGTGTEATPHYRYTTHAKGHNTVKHHSYPLVQDFDPKCANKLYS